MKAFQQLTSQVIPMDMNNIDTDMIIPAQFLTKVDREGYGEHLFKRLGEQDKHFVFNDPSYAGAEILLTRENFACGSSREHAVWALMQAGIKVIIAESYSDIFYSNAGKNGLLAIQLSKNTVHRFMEKAKQEKFYLTIDLNAQSITSVENEITYFNYDPFRKACFLKGQDDLDYLLEATKNA